MGIGAVCVIVVTVNPVRGPGTAEHDIAASRDQSKTVAAAGPAEINVAPIAFAAQVIVKTGPPEINVAAMNVTVKIIARPHAVGIDVAPRPGPSGQPFQHVSGTAAGEIDAAAVGLQREFVAGAGAPESDPSAAPAPVEIVSARHPPEIDVTVSGDGIPDLQIGVGTVNPDTPMAPSAPVKFGIDADAAHIDVAAAAPVMHIGITRCPVEIDVSPAAFFNFDSAGSASEGKMPPGVDPPAVAGQAERGIVTTLGPDRARNPDRLDVVVPFRAGIPSGKEKPGALI